MSIMWILLSLIGYGILAIVALMDKFILSKSVKPIIFTFYSSIFVLPILFFIPFGVSFPTVWTDWLIFLISGFFFSIGLWVMYLGYQRSEISHIGPLVGAATPFFILLLSGIFLKESFGFYTLLAIFILILGSLLVSFENSQKHNGVHLGMLFGVVSGLFFAISHVAAKYAYDVLGFYSGFVWTRTFIGIFGIILFLSPSIRQIFKRKKDNFSEKKSQLSLISWNKILGVVGIVLIQYATALGSVTLVNALAGVQFAILIILVALFSRFYPKLFKEQYTKREVVQEFVAILLIGGGLAFMLI